MPLIHSSSAILLVFIFAFILELIQAQTCGPQNVQANFGTSPSTTVPQNPCVPTLAYDQSSIWLVWNKPDNYTSIVDYNVYMVESCGQRRFLGSAKENALKNSASGAYIRNFYESDKEGFHVKLTHHSFLATGLEANKTYKITVKSVDRKGKESKESAILSAMTAPDYDKIVKITDFGAIADNSTLNTLAIQQAINNCSSNSTSAYGCKVVVPAGGIFLTGPIMLKSNMSFELEEGAILKATTDASLFNSSDTILAMISNNNTAKNIRLIGKGTLDGSGWKLAETVVDELGRQLPVYAKANASTVGQLGLLAANQVAASGGGSAAYNSRSTLVNFSKMTNLYIGGGLRFVNPSKDTIKVTSNSANIVLANVHIETYNANNGDGIGIGISLNFLAFNNFFNTGDDCIATNSGQGAAGQIKQSVQYLWIFNNYFREGHGAFVVGSQTAAWMQDILVEDNVLFLTDNGLRMKSTPSTGGGARRIVFRDTAMLGVGVMRGNVTLGGRQFVINQPDLGGQYTQSPFIMTLAYSAGNSAFEAANASAQFRDIQVSRVSVDGKGTPILHLYRVDNGKPGQGGSFIAVDGYDGKNPSLNFTETFQTNLTFIDVKFKNVAPANISRLAESSFVNVTVTNWGNASSPWMIRDSKNLTFTNVQPKPKEEF